MSPRKAKPKRKPKIPTPQTPDVEVRANTVPVRSRMDKTASLTSSPIYRYLETFFFIAAGIQLLLLGTVETLHRAGIRLGKDDPDHGFPYGVLIGSVIMIAPKLVGRMFAGRALVAIAGRGESTGYTGEQQAASKGGE